jgi:hypothetical protein
MICKKKKSQLLTNPLGVPKGVQVLTKFQPFVLTAEFKVRNQLNKNKTRNKDELTSPKNYLLDEAK